MGLGGRQKGHNLIEEVRGLRIRVPDTEYLRVARYGVAVVARLRGREHVQLCASAGPTEQQA